MAIFAMNGPMNGFFEHDSTVTACRIKEAVMNGLRVYKTHKGYEVIYAPEIDEFLIKCHMNDRVIGLTWKDGVTLNAYPEEFFCENQN